MDLTSECAVRRALRCILIMEASAQMRGGELSRAQLTQLVLAQCVVARRALRTILVPEQS